MSGDLSFHHVPQVPSAGAVSALSSDSQALNPEGPPLARAGGGGSGSSAELVCGRGGGFGVGEGRSQERSAVRRQASLQAERGESRRAYGLTDLGSRVFRFETLRPRIHLRGLSAGVNLAHFML